MVMAMEVMDRGLRDDFGFEHLAWVYSGRRGVHCWVCDEGARGMGNEARGAVAGYFEVSRRVMNGGCEQQRRMVLLTNNH